MLTSGSTGNSKAVKITYKQIRAAIEGKASARQPPPDKPFLNWVGLDHVGSLAEIHLLALALGLDQVHVQPADVVSSPLTFLDLLSHHHVSRSFAPNFFLSKLLAAVGSSKEGKTWDLKDLDFMVSGGEANDMETVLATAELFSRLGARPDVLVPGFGMTETCAGSIYNTNCPEADVRHGRSVASLGRCVQGIEMRVMLSTGANSRRLAVLGETGDLEVRGDIVFEGYYRNPAATAEALSPDGWFRTGDQATIDSEGNLNLMGRVKDVLNIRGVKIPTADVQATLEKTLSGEVAYVVCFPSRAVETHTEQVTVAFIPKSWPIRPEDAAAIHQSIIEASIVCTGSRPSVFALRDQSQLPISTLGKIPRSKMRSLYEKGVFDKDVEDFAEALVQHRTNTVKLPPSQLEAALLGDVAEIIGADLERLDIDTPVFDLGFNSLDLIRLKNRVDKRLATNVPLTTYLRSPTVRSLASNLSSTYNISQTSDGVAATPTYDPVVPLLTKGSKTPLWLIHPGVGEILVFIGLSHHLVDDDRPVYALRAPGFDPGQKPFDSVEDAVTTYHEAITKHQPQGPYAIAGYSYGSMLAYEVAKRLESESGATVQFTGSFNLPPHIKHRMRQLNWNMCLLNLVQFLDLVPESYVEEIDDGFSAVTRDESLATVLSVVDRTRMLELGLDESALTSWTHVAYSLQSMAVDYDPSGSIDSMDVFHAIPLKIAAKSKEDWVENHLSKWRDFTRGDVRFHEAEGSHYTMIGPNHVAGFAQILKRALRERGL
jgi:thioesterase domain-containing protein